ncbi:MAG: ATP-binding protein [Nitrospiraceae bacterium]|nr:ATP-binding protein [Nitrospiraceae bacterium]
MEAERASLRARDLTQQLLTFSRGGEPVKKSISVENLVRDSVGFVLRGSKSRAELDVPEGLWPVEADEGQINQVIHNLILNSDQAMSSGGIITVRCENVVIGPVDANVLRNGRYVKITIKDEGIGIPKEHMKKIFDPYFTTKQKGSGLGLTGSYAIIKKHDGNITVESELGIGTTFHVYLPASDKEHLSGDIPEDKVQRGKGRILIMDDEEMVSAIAGEILKELGYNVEFSSGGAEVIEKYQKAKESDEPFDIVIMDLTIPGGVGGEGAIKKLLEIDPHLKAIASSGYCNHPVMSNFREYGFKAVITKPYKLEEISAAVHEVMFSSQANANKD